MDTQFQDRLNRLRRERGLSQEDLDRKSVV